MSGFVSMAEYQRVCEERDELREELAYVRETRGGPDWIRVQLRDALRLTPNEAAILAKLYADRAKPGVSRGVLLDLLLARGGGESEALPKILDVYVCRIKKKVGRRDIIVTVFGFGFRPTPEGAALVERVTTAKAVAA